MIPASGPGVTPLPRIASMRWDLGMTNNDSTGHHDAAADAKQAASGSQGNPEPANEDTPDGQFDDQQMPTTDGEPASGEDPATSGGSESQEEGDAAMKAAEDATRNSGSH